ncbi:biotin/lipoyl-binding protein [Siminovitchia sp. FSL H7-0308]|uniref:Multidrug efflux pump subunit AcrA (Membrane-fusion protein) n=1 Tax=Siminovitchia thermophila TaxID=1245522 RepID=A0ABS2R8Z1_9BACI|nr:biotin/lipoyl-binding protein [Siminovitchia thermophila]MBM7716122.1 multidrug efflux pump subunit AcrA (membrane-fusion protein) [Siminovitchia thermophila]ONK22428.1 ABC transporter substrate-binding protein [Bacillus sp. VT-16-64]
MKKKVWIWILSIVVGLGIIAAIVFFFIQNRIASVSEEMSEETFTVQKAAERELSETILVTGKIVPESEQKVFIEPDKGSIIEYSVAENQKVKAGDPLFKYDASKLQSELNKAVRERDLIQKRAKAEEKQIADMNKRIKNAKANSGSASASSEQEAEVPIESVDDLTKEKTEIEIQHETTKAEIVAAQEQINDLDKQIKEMTVVSKIDGMVVKVDKNAVSTENASPEPVVHIISNQPFKVIGTMSEFDAVKIKEKQSVIIRPKVYKDREWKGEIESVSQFPNEEGSGGGEDFSGGGGSGGSVTMYPFKVKITDDTSELRQGFHVSLEINVAAEGKSLAIPHAALHEEDGADVVYVLKDDKLERREVQKGAMNDEFVEIKEGVKKDELVVIEPTEGLHDGMEVTSFDEVE